MKIYFFNMGNSSKSGGFSSYSRFLSETSIDRHIIKISDFGTLDKNSVNIFFRTVGIERHTSFSYVLHKINLALYFLIFISLLILSNWTDLKIWVQSSFISRSKILRFFALKIGRKRSLIIDVRDKEFFPYINMFSNFKFISCGSEINDKILLFTEQVVNITTPISREDRELIGLVKAENYILYAHGIQEDKAPEAIIQFLNLINSSDYMLVLCGRIRTQDNGLVNKILQHNKVRYVGNLDKLVILALIKSSRGVLITGENEGVPRILEEAKNFSVTVITPKKQAYLTGYDDVFTYEEFAKAFPLEGSRLPENNSYNSMIEKLERFIFED